MRSGKVTARGEGGHALGSNYANYCRRPPPGPLVLLCVAYIVFGLALLHHLPQVRLCSVSTLAHPDFSSVAATIQLSRGMLTTARSSSYSWSGVSQLLRLGFAQQYVWSMRTIRPAYISLRLHTVVLMFSLCAVCRPSKCDIGCSVNYFLWKSTIRSFAHWGPGHTPAQQYLQQFALQPPCFGPEPDLSLVVQLHAMSFIARPRKRSPLDLGGRTGFLIDVTSEVDEIWCPFVALSHSLAYDLTRFRGRCM